MAVPKVLIASTTWWSSNARMASALAALGCDVAAIYPRGNPLAATRVLAQSHTYRATRPLRSLRAAIEASVPDLIVPCDDRVVQDLHALHSAAQQSGDRALQGRIERSLGVPESFAVAAGRIGLLDLAAAEGLQIPASRAVASAEDLRAWGRTHRLPWVLKSDGSWAGFGVKVAADLDAAERQFRELASPLSARRFLKHLLVDADPFPLPQYLARVRPPVTVQQFIHGTPANTAVACWEGEVLAVTSAMTLAVARTNGASTVVRIIDNAQMRATAERLVQRLGLSGFVGFDFVIERATGDSYLIEMNPRCTPLTALRLGAGHDPVAALATRLSGKAPGATAPVTTADTVAFFPQAWQCDPASPYLRSAYHDVPWEQPELVKELARTPWPQRGVLVWLYRRTLGAAPAHAAPTAAVPT